MGHHGRTFSQPKHSEATPHIQMIAGLGSEVGRENSIVVENPGKDELLFNMEQEKKDEPSSKVVSHQHHMSLSPGKLK